MKHVDRRGKERRLETGKREGQGEMNTKERAMSRRAEAGNKLGSKPIQTVKEKTRNEEEIE